MIQMLKQGQSFWAVYPTMLMANVGYSELLYSREAGQFDFVKERMAVLVKSTNQMQVPVFGRFISLDSDPAITAISKAIIYFPFTTAGHPYATRWLEQAKLMEGHRVGQAN
jgi:hypothetical protein